MPLLIGRPQSLAAVRVAAEGSGLIVLASQNDPSDNWPGISGIRRVAVVARLRGVNRLPNGTTRIIADIQDRVRLSRHTEGKDPLPDDSEGNSAVPIFASITPFPLEPRNSDNQDLIVRARHALSVFEEYSAMHRRVPPEIAGVLQGINDPVRLAYGIASHMQIPMERKQEMLEVKSLESFLKKLSESLASELDLLKLERKIDDQVRGALFQHQREFFLQEQLKAIHRELNDEGTDDLEELEAQLRSKVLSESIQQRVDRELRKLKKMSASSPEAGVSRGWLDWIAALPWKEMDREAISIAEAEKVLNADHYGLKEPKDRILDYMAVLERVGNGRGQVLCLVGPPGVGKTSLARSIASAMGRKFIRLSLGGVRDESEIRGHRRTYIGSMPGRIIQGMRRAGVMNPVMLLDELDKLGSDWRGDPSSALLEVLDPEQNKAFSDHYLEVDYDLSHVLFITTANSLSGIPEALRDRLEIIRLPGYLEPEKCAIAARHLLPFQLNEHALEKGDVVLDDDTVMAIIRGWTREAGVRDLERRIARLVRKVNRSLIESGDTSLPITVVPDDLEKWLGVAPYQDDNSDTLDKVGVANGLAYTSVGGELLEIEVSVIPGRGKLQLTGTLGDVMKESASAALTWVRSRLEILNLPLDTLQRSDMHVHVPAGATPKDGPSAGIAMATAMVSALTGRAVKGTVAMTGEVTLRGRVLPIGGLREKGVAAHRNRLTDVIVPHANTRDLTELPEEVKDGINWHSVKTMDEVLALALTPSATEAPAQKKRSTTKRTAAAASIQAEH